MTDRMVSSERRMNFARSGIALYSMIVAELWLILTIVPSARGETTDVNLATTPFITSDPIGNHAIGGVFFINGSTNLPVSEMLRMEIYSTVIKSVTKNYP